MFLLINLFGTSASVAFLAEYLLLAFVGILFLQSGFDKVFDYRGNKSYIASVFEKTPLHALSGLLFLSITLLEVAAGVLCFVGLGSRLLSGNGHWAAIGMGLAAVSILCLFFGQRMAKDYAGAASLVSYFILTIIGLLLIAANGLN